MNQPDRLPDDSTASVPPQVPLIVMGVGGLLAIALLAQAKAGGNWAIGGCLAAAVVLGSSLLGRLVVWWGRVHETRSRQEAERLRVMDRIAERLDRLIDHLEDSTQEPEIRPAARPDPLQPQREPARVVQPDPHVTGPALDPIRARRLAQFRSLIRDGLWNEAAAIAEEHAESTPNDPEELRRELTTARPARIDTLRGELLAAREVQDANRVIELRGELLNLLPPAEQVELNRDLATWLLLLVQRRCLTGKVAVDVVNLAEQVARLFAETREGASLRASLPTLRRCAGLCPDCSQPYNGEERACPRCLIAVAPSPNASPSWPVDGDPDEDGASSPAVADMPPNGHAPAPQSPRNGGTGP